MIGSPRLTLQVANVIFRTLKAIKAVFYKHILKTGRISCISREYQVMFYHSNLKNHSFFQTYSSYNFIRNINRAISLIPKYTNYHTFYLKHHIMEVWLPIEEAARKQAASSKKFSSSNLIFQPAYSLILQELNDQIFLQLLLIFSYHHLPLQLRH